MEDLDILKNAIESIVKKLFNVKTLVDNHGLQNEYAINNLIEQYDYFISLKKSLESFRNPLNNNYLKNVQDILLKYHDNLHFIPTNEITSDQSHNIKEILYLTAQNFGSAGGYIHFNEIFNNIVFILNFFKQLNYLTKNMVLLGANGSGKSSLAFNLKHSLGKYSLIISAQKLLLIPEFDSISNPQNTKISLLNQQENVSHHRYTYQADENIPSLPFIQDVANYFKNLLTHLLAEKAEANHHIVESIRAQGINNIQNIPDTNLDKVIKVWNSIFIHRSLICNHLNLQVRDNILEEEYSANLMSDGEKVGLFYISLVLQVPENSLIIVDEPEMYLHKTILNKMWDSLEALRSDCIFLYLTHDIEFATARYNSKKYWLSNYKFPNNWNINEIENIDELPEHLLLELVGSRKNILFCEGQVGNIDDEIYKIIFPNFTVKPVGSCTNVINYTRAFKKINNLTTQAYGLIDSDFCPNNRLDKLAKEQIYSLKVAEVENLLLDEELLKIVIATLLIDKKDEVLNAIKEIILSSVLENIEIQTANYITAEINFYFEETNVTKGNTKTDVEINFETFISKIKIDEIYNKRKVEIQDIINNKDYLSVLKVYNHKGLSTKIHNILEVNPYKDFAIRLLKTSPEARECIKRHFPENLKNEGC